MTCSIFNSIDIECSHTEKIFSYPVPCSLEHGQLQNIGTLSVQELFFQLIGLLGVRLGVSPVGMVELFVHGASLTT